MKSNLFVIVRFDVANGKLESLLLLIKDFFEKEVSTFPGFISYKLHANQEGTVVINYAMWQSIEDFQKFRAYAGTSELSKRIQGFNPHADVVYEVSNS